MLDGKIKHTDQQNINNKIKTLKNVKNKVNQFMNS